MSYIPNKWAAPQALAPTTLRLPEFQANPMQKAAFGVTALFIWLMYSRLQDFAPYLHIPAITMALATIVTLVSGNIRTISKAPVTKWTIALTVWMFACVPFSVWHGGTLDSLVNVWLKAVLVYAVVTTSLVIPRYCTRMITVAAFGILCGALIGLLTGGTSAQDRIGELNLRFDDANEFAQVLLIGMCLLLGYSVTPGRSSVGKVIAYAGVAVMLMSFFRTGSRGGFIGLITIVLFVFIKESVASKAAMLVLAAIVTVCVMAFLPSTVRQRYTTMFGGGADDPTDNAAIAAAGSTQSRQYLLMQSLRITAQHPLFGVGAGMFAVAENSVAMDEGKARGNWHETHNMYTQVSSENGIPGCVLFVIAIIVAFRALNRVIHLGKGRSDDPVLLEASRSAYWIRVALLSMIASGFFLSIAYSNELQVLIAFAMGLNYSVDSYIQFLEGQPGAMTGQPVPATFAIPGYRKPVRPPTWSNA